MKRSWPAILIGVALIVVLVPGAQFLTILTVNSDLETATPVGWAVGLIFSFVLIAATVRWLGKRSTLDRPRLVIIYCMLTISVPVMNLGLIRQVFWAMYAVTNEYLRIGNSTYRIAFNAQNPHWFPVVPTLEGLAYNKADRLLRLLQDHGVLKQRAAIQRQLAAGQPADLTQLGADECATLLAQGKDRPGLREQMERATARSREAATRLTASLAGVDEFALSALPAFAGALDVSSAQRLERELARVSDRAAFDAQGTSYLSHLPAWRADVTVLARADYAAVRTALAEPLVSHYRAWDAARLNRERGSFLYRLSKADRVQLMMQDGRDSQPNQNVLGFAQTLWDDATAQQAKQQQPWRENIAEVIARLPWLLWVWPVVLWGALCLVIFGLLLGLADWLRKKWIERENLAFPLVEVADSLLRQDAELESAEDPRHPPARRRGFAPLWAGGVAAGLVWVSVEALGHYGFLGSQPIVCLDVTKQVFAQNAALREMTGVVLVISPIVLGLAFLVSLEISFSVWALFFILNFAFMLCRLGGIEVKAPLFTGWAGGRFFPFWIEQFLGASVCFSAILLTKACGGRAKSRQWLGGAALALAGVALLGHFGMTNLAFIALVALLVVAQTVTAARLRAETGLPTHHVSYEFSKLPMVFGLTGWLGAEVYTRFIALAFLPMSLLTRLLPQQLENLELARRHKVAPRTIVISAVVGFATAWVVGAGSFLIFSYYLGDSFQGNAALPGQGPATTAGILRYPLWVSHFFGENGLDKFTQVHWKRIGFMALGAGIVGALVFLRQRFLKFPLHPLGYLILLFSIYYEWISPYYKGDGQSRETSWLWGSVFVAWLVKKLIIKYGGMTTYKHTKPLFLGLVIGAVVAIFGWNVCDLICSVHAEHVLQPGDFVKHFLDKPAFSPRFY
jgi:hypothetical protein